MDVVKLEEIMLTDMVSLGFTEDEAYRSLPPKQRFKLLLKRKKGAARYWNLIKLHPLVQKIISNFSNADSAIENKAKMLEFFDVSNDLIKHNTKKYTKRDLGRIKNVVWHHSSSDKDEVGGIARYHVQDKGWPGIGYHLVIDREGKVIVTNKLNVGSYQTSGQNFNTIGICVLGDFSKKLPNEDQLGAVMLVSNMIKLFRPDWVHKGHRDFKATECPGEEFYQWLIGKKII